MMFKTRTDIGFQVPDEIQTMRKFEAENPDWRKSETSQMVWYTHEELYQSEIEQEDE